MKSQVNKNPEDWKIVKLEDVILDIGDGGTPSTKIKEYFNGTIPWVNIEDIKRDIYDTRRYLSEVGLKNSSAKLWPEGTIIFSFGASIGKVGIARVKLCTKQGIAGIVPDPNKVDSEFLYYVLVKESEKIKKIGQSMGSTIREVRPSKLVKLIVFGLPPLSEQKTIAQILSTVDKAIQKVEEIIAKTERLKKGLMKELLTGRIRVEGKDGKIVFRKETEFKEDAEIGKIPKDWEVVKLGDVLELCQYGLSIPLKEKGKYPIVRMDEIVNGYITPNVVKYVDLDEETFKKFKLEKGDILFNRTNAPDLVGRTGIFLLEGEYVFASYLIRLRVKHEIFDPHFLTFYLIFSEERFKQLATRAVHQANINATNLKMLKIPRPDTEEQQKIAKILSTIDKKLELEIKRKEKLGRIKKSLMDSLLTGKVRVKV